jgi:uncharacterized transporter YbjL
VDIEVTRDEPVGIALKDLHCLRERGIVFSRLLREQKLTVPTATTKIQKRDLLRAVGPQQLLADAVASLGRESKADLARVARVSQDLHLARSG